MSEELLDSIVGQHLSGEEMLSTFLSAEVRLLNKIVSDFSLNREIRLEIIRALFRFRKLLFYYTIVWSRTERELNPRQRNEAEKAFAQVRRNLQRDSLSCFSHSHFFGYIRFLLHACKELGVSEKRQDRYMQWLLSFPITLEKSMRDVLEHEIAPVNRPHIYMRMVAGMIRNSLTDGKDHKKICGEYRTFLKERHVSKAHTIWFNKRLSGSYGSRQ